MRTLLQIKENRGHAFHRSKRNRLSIPIDGYKTVRRILLVFFLSIGCYNVYGQINQQTLFGNPQDNSIVMHLLPLPAGSGRIPFYNNNKTLVEDFTSKMNATVGLGKFNGYQTYSFNDGTLSKSVVPNHFIDQHLSLFFVMKPDALIKQNFWIQKGKRNDTIVYLRQDNQYLIYEARYKEASEYRFDASRYEALGTVVYEDNSTPLRDIVDITSELPMAITTQLPGYTSGMDIYCVYTEEGLKNLENATVTTYINGTGGGHDNAYVILGNDMQLVGNWTPLSSGFAVFNGNFNYITDLTVNISKNGGFFGHLTPSFPMSFFNIYFENIDVSGGQGPFGGLAGTIEADNVHIERVHVLSGNIGSTSITAATNMGGLVGILKGGSFYITQSSSNADVVGNSFTGAIGGLFGQLHNTSGESNITDLYSTANLNCSGTGTGCPLPSTSTSSLGGIIGYQQQSGTFLRIYRVYFSGSLPGCTTCEGAIAGSVFGSINSYDTYSNLTNDLYGYTFGTSSHTNSSNGTNDITYFYNNIFPKWSTDIWNSRQSEGLLPNFEVHKEVLLADTVELNTTYANLVELVITDTQLYFSGSDVNTTTGLNWPVFEQTTSPLTHHNWSSNLSNELNIGMGDYTGDLYDVWLFRQTLEEPVRQKIISALSLKYGITKNTEGGEYVYGDGTTSIPADLNLYESHIFGVSKDDDMSIDQDSAVNEALGNLIYIKASLSNKSTLALSARSMYASTNTAVFDLFKEQWRVTKTGTVSNISFGFPMVQKATYPGVKLLILRKNGTLEQQDPDASPSLYYRFSNVSVNNEDFIQLIISEPLRAVDDYYIAKFRTKVHEIHVIANDTTKNSTKAVTEQPKLTTIPSSFIGTNPDDTLLQYTVENLGIDSLEYDLSIPSLGLTDTASVYIYVIPDTLILYQSNDGHCNYDARDTLQKLFDLTTPNGKVPLTLPSEAQKMPFGINKLSFTVSPYLHVPLNDFVYIRFIDTFPPIMNNPDTQKIDLKTCTQDLASLFSATDCNFDKIVIDTIPGENYKGYDAVKQRAIRSDTFRLQVTAYDKYYVLGAKDTAQHVTRDTVVIAVKDITPPTLIFPAPIEFVTPTSCGDTLNGLFQYDCGEIISTLVKDTLGNVLDPTQAKMINDTTFVAFRFGIFRIDVTVEDLSGNIARDSMRVELIPFDQPELTIGYQGTPHSKDTLRFFPDNGCDTAILIKDLLINASSTSGCVLDTLFTTYITSKGKLDTFTINDTIHHKMDDTISFSARLSDFYYEIFDTFHIIFVDTFPMKLSVYDTLRLFPQNQCNTSFAVNSILKEAYDKTSCFLDTSFTVRGTTYSGITDIGPFNVNDTLKVVAHLTDGTQNKQDSTIIIVIDTISPIIEAQSETIYLQTQCDTTYDISKLLIFATDWNGCNIDTFFIVQLEGESKIDTLFTSNTMMNLSARDTLNVTIAVTDTSNTAYEKVQLYILDTIAPRLDITPSININVVLSCDSTLDVMKFLKSAIDPNGCAVDTQLFYRRGYSATEQALTPPYRLNVEVGDTVYTRFRLSDTSNVTNKTTWYTLTENTPPTVSITDARTHFYPKVGCDTIIKSFAITANDNCEVRDTTFTVIHQEAPTGITSKLPIRLIPGKNTIIAIITDKSGLIARDTTSVIVKDTVSPEIELRKELYTYAQTSNRTKLYTASDNCALRNTTDTIWDEQGSIVTATELPIGKYDVIVWAWDTAGSFNKVRGTFRVIDKAKPTITLQKEIFLPENGIIQGLDTMFYQASDNGGFVIYCPKDVEINCKQNSVTLHISVCDTGGIENWRDYATDADGNLLPNPCDELANVSNCLDTMFTIPVRDTFNREGTERLVSIGYDSIDITHHTFRTLVPEVTGDWLAEDGTPVKDTLIRNLSLTLGKHRFIYQSTTCGVPITLTIEVFLPPNSIEVDAHFVTPNGDGLNDYLKLHSLKRIEGLPNKLIIYNKFGGVVYEAKDIKTSNLWNGYNQATGKTALSGTYFFHFTILDYVFQSYVEVIRKE